MHKRQFPRFLAHSNFPELKLVDLRSAILKSGAAKELVRFPKLKKVETYRSDISQEDIKFLKAHGIKVYVYPDEN